MASNRVTVTLQGEDLGVFDFEQFTVSDGILVKAHTGLSVKQFFDGIGEMDAQALQAFVWLLKRRKGEAVADPRAIDFPIAQLQVEGEPDPTTEAAPVPAAAIALEAEPATDPALVMTSGSAAAAI